MMYDLIFFIADILQSRREINGAKENLNSC